MLRNEGEPYGRKLAPAGVAVSSIRYNGTIHDLRRTAIARLAASTPVK